jgi:hypothetical protein
MGHHQTECVLEKLLERVLAELSRSHRKFAVLLRAFAANMTIHPDVVGRVGENRGSLVSRQEEPIGVRIQCVSAKETMRPEGPEVV